MTFDVIIRRGAIVDGTGKNRYVADIGIRDGKIEAIGDIPENGATSIDATGRLVTPGFIDIHTHYDGQVSWDDAMEPSASHGVTTIVMGNCGVGFAPVRRGQEAWLIQLMEGVEDIPGTALHEGIKWNWESFPDYLDALSKNKYSLDIAAQLPHGALRAYVMGERGAADAPATPDELREMARLTREAVESGAVGFSTSRTGLHQAKDGRTVPGTNVANEELMAINHAMRAGGGAVFEMVPGGRGVVGAEDPWTMEHELELLAAVGEQTGIPSTFSVGQSLSDPVLIHRVLEAADGVLARTRTRLQFSGRSGGVLIGLKGCHVFQRKPTYTALAAGLPFDQLVERLRDPRVKEAILTEDDPPLKPGSITDRFDLFLRAHLDVIYALGDPPNYEPEPSQSVTSIAKSQGRDPMEVCYDLMLDQGGHAILIALTTNYADGNLDIVEKMLRHPKTVLGLGDGGAHARYICDASTPTFVLSHWGRDRVRGRTVELATLVRKQTYEPALLYGFSDRGSIEVGKRADLNIIDYDGLKLGSPYYVDDLPTGARRVLQKAVGYDITMVNGVITRRNGADTGARPGRLLRGRGV